MSIQKKTRSKLNLRCTINQELFKAWQLLRREDDPKKICDAYEWSRPTVDNALNFGYVMQEKLTGNINEFFKKRLEEEREASIELLTLNEAIKSNDTSANS